MAQKLSDVKSPNIFSKSSNQTCTIPNSESNLTTPYVYLQSPVYIPPNVTPMQIWSPFSVGQTAARSLLTGDYRTTTSSVTTNKDQIGDMNYSKLNETKSLNNPESQRMHSQNIRSPLVMKSILVPQKPQPIRPKLVKPMTVAQEGLNDTQPIRQKPVKSMTVTQESLNDPPFSVPSIVHIPTGKIKPLWHIRSSCPNEALLQKPDNETSAAVAPVPSVEKTAEETPINSFLATGKQPPNVMKETCVQKNQQLPTEREVSISVPKTSDILPGKTTIRSEANVQKHRQRETRKDKVSDQSFSTIRIIKMQDGRDKVFHSKVPVEPAVMSRGRSLLRPRIDSGQKLFPDTSSFSRTLPSTKIFKDSLVCSPAGPRTAETSVNNNVSAIQTRTEQLDSEKTSDCFEVKDAPSLLPDIPSILNSNELSAKRKLASVKDKLERENKDKFGCPFIIFESNGHFIKYSLTKLTENIACENVSSDTSRIPDVDKASENITLTPVTIKNSDLIKDNSVKCRNGLEKLKEVSASSTESFPIFMLSEGTRGCKGYVRVADLQTNKSLEKVKVGVHLEEKMPVTKSLSLPNVKPTGREHPNDKKEHTLNKMSEETISKDAREFCNTNENFSIQLSQNICSDTAKNSCMETGAQKELAYQDNNHSGNKLIFIPVIPDAEHALHNTDENDKVHHDSEGTQAKIGPTPVFLVPNRHQHRAFYSAIEENEKKDVPVPITELLNDAITVDGKTLDGCGTKQSHCLMKDNSKLCLSSKQFATDVKKITERPDILHIHGDVVKLEPVNNEWLTNETSCDTRCSNRGHDLIADQSTSLDSSTNVKVKLEPMYIEQSSSLPLNLDKTNEIAVDGRRNIDLMPKQFRESFTSLESLVTCTLMETVPSNTYTSSIVPSDIVEMKLAYDTSLNEANFDMPKAVDQSSKIKISPNSFAPVVKTNAEPLYMDIRQHVTSDHVEREPVSYTSKMIEETKAYLSDKSFEKYVLPKKRNSNIKSSSSSIFIDDASATCAYLKTNPGNVLRTDVIVDCKKDKTVRKRKRIDASSPEKGNLIKKIKLDTVNKVDDTTSIRGLCCTNVMHPDNLFVLPKKTDVEGQQFKSVFLDHYGYAFRILENEKIVALASRFISKTMDDHIYCMRIY